MDSNLFGLCSNPGMSQRHPDGKRSPIAKRVRAVMILLGDKRQADFAARLRVEMKRVNNAMTGFPLSTPLAQRIRIAVPGMTRDWLYEGDEGGLPVSLRDALRVAEEAVETKLSAGAELA